MFQFTDLNKETKTRRTERNLWVLRAITILFCLMAIQEMPSRQRKSAKKGSRRYLMFGPNRILVTLPWKEGRSPGHKNVCRRFLNR